MKLSISWIFQHIDADWRSINIEDLIAKFNRTTAEIEGFEKINVDLTNLFVAQVKEIEVDNVILSIPELGKDIELKKREGLKQDSFYLVKKLSQHEFVWARSIDLAAHKDMPLPAINVDKDLVSGKWKNSFPAHDYIIEVDNKSITHRPDLWGQRGFAREFAAILNLELLPLEQYLQKCPILDAVQDAVINNENFTIEINAPKYCKRLAVLSLDNVKNKATDLKMLALLSRIDSRCINEIVDATNYTMFDLGQPMHAFDADKIIGNKIQARLAMQGERLALLDETVVELTEKDLVIADEQRAIALAGIMGGANSQVDENTKSILLEAACFDASIIRLSSIRHKKRTEASARFEKTLDPNQNTIAIERYLKLINSECPGDIISLGKKTHENKINVSHQFIQDRLGCEIPKDFIQKTLHKLGFKVSGQYEITVPTWRGSKDVSIPEEIVEEIGRFYGYDNIPFLLPLKQMIPNDLTKVEIERKIKQLMAFACKMHEVQNYPFYDESFLKEINWQPEKAVQVISPVSENWQRLVTSLIPHLIKNVINNLGKEQNLNFFELNKSWHVINNESHEKNLLSGIFYNYNSKINFVFAKNNLLTLFNLLKLDVQWVKVTGLEQNPWFDKYQSADLISNGRLIGRAGMLSENFSAYLPNGAAFIFDLDAEFLIEHKTQVVKFKPLPKYPTVWLDISMFVALDKNIDDIKNLIKNADSLIYKVELVDVFEKAEWGDKKSLTMRYHFVDENKTLTKEEIDSVASKVIQQLNSINAQLR